MTRRLIALPLVLLLVLVAPNADAQEKGGVLRIGNLGGPPSLDPHWGTQTITEVFTNHVLEVLHSLDDKYQPVPMLAEAMPTVSRDELTYTIKLRKRGEALARACAAGATAASPGAQPSLPTAARLEEIVAR